MFGKTQMKGNRNFSLEGIRTIWVTGSFHDIIFFHGGSELTLEEYLAPNTEIAHVEKRGDALYFEADMHPHVTLNLFSEGGGSERMEFYVPAGFSGQIYAESASGDIDISGDWKIANLQLETASGDIEIGRIAAEHFLVETKSGDIDAEEVWGDRQFFSTSGDVEIGGGSGDIHVQTVSGDIDVAGLSGKTALETVSGDIDARFEKIAQDIEISSISGDLDIRMACGNSYRITAATTSGDLSVHVRDMNVLNENRRNIEAAVGVSSLNRADVPTLSASAVSGDISIFN